MSKTKSNMSRFSKMFLAGKILVKNCQTRSNKYLGPVGFKYFEVYLIQL